MLRTSAALLLIGVAPISDAGASATVSTAPSTPAFTIASFRDRMMTAVRNAHPDSNIAATGATTFVVSGQGLLDVTINVDNAYAQYLSAPDTIDALIDRYLSALVRASADDGATPEQIVVIVRPSTYIRDSVRKEADLANFVPPRPMAGDLSFFLAVDAPQTIRTVSIDDLVRWKLDAEAAWQRGIANIKTRIGPLSMGPVEGLPDSATAIGGASGLAPSLLAQPLSCGPTALSGVVGQIVLVAAKDAIILGVPSDRGSMRRFWKTAKAMIASNGSLSSTPMTCRDGHWVAIAIP